MVDIVRLAEGSPRRSPTMRHVAPAARPRMLTKNSLDNLDVSPCDFQVFKFLEFAEPPRILI